ncbi:MAG: diguanylate cyclase [Treponema sp.]|nr:diguanylate cyclase [Candidatus Treponema caballi]
MMEITIELLQKILEFIPSCIFFKDTECRYAFATHFNTNPVDMERSDVRGKTDLEVFGDTPAGREAYETTKKIIETRKGVCFVNDYSVPGKEAFIEIKMEPVYDDKQNIMGVVGLMHDITARVLLERQLETSARTDSLTGLYNRFYLDYWRKNILKPDMFPLFIISADCDGLKEMNDTYGHQVGDEYLHLTTSVFRVGLPEEAIKFRTGGDEFLMLIPKTTKEQGERHIEHMESYSKHVTLRQKPIQISFGSSIIETYGDDFMEAIKTADQNMYRMKEAHHKARK